MRISDWSSDVCSSDLGRDDPLVHDSPWWPESDDPSLPTALSRRRFVQGDEGARAPGASLSELACRLGPIRSRGTSAVASGSMYRRRFAVGAGATGGRAGRGPDESPGTIPTGGQAGI